MSHVHAFLCIRTLSSLYFDILSYWCFSDCLSLSFFLALVCSMAPKRKSTPSRNPLHSGVSSSSPSNPIPSHVWFRDEKAKSDFSENFSWWGIHLEHQVVLSDFSDINLPTVIYSRGWESLCGIPVTCPSVIIQEFYSNMHGIDTCVPYFFSRVWGTHIVVTSEIVSEVLHIPRVAHPDYPSYEHLKTVSKDELSTLFCETPFSWGDCQNTFIHCLTITLSQSLVLNFCYPSQRMSLSTSLLILFYHL